MYIENISVEAGKVFEIPVKLDNENTYSAFQCDILLPQGIEMETDEDGELLVYAENSRMTTSHTITAHLREDGWIRVASYSTTSKDLKGNSGTLFYIKAKVNSDYSGEMVIRMKEIIMSNAEAETVTLEDTEAVISVTPYQGENPECKDRMYIEDISVGAGKVFEIPVKLDNENTYSAFQCDILLPQGIEIETDEDGELLVYAENSRMTTSHTITAHLREDGWIRVASYSTTSKNLKGNSGTLFYIKAKVSSDYSGEMVIRMKKIIMSNADAETVTLEDTEAVISVGTHINNVLINNEFTDIYTLQGIVVKPGNSANRYKKELPSGIYIINGKKVYIKQK